MTARQIRRLLLFLLGDLFLFGLCLCLYALFHHVLPHSIGHLYGAVESGVDIDFSERYPDRFTQNGEIQRGDDYYRDGDLDLTLKTCEEDGVVYHVADFYIRSIQNFRTGMAGEEFATGVADTVLNMAEKYDALLAISGDYFGIRQRGVVIRNGEIYRKTRAHQVCVLYQNGTMETYPYASFDVEKAIAGGAWQAWDFGPALLDKNGKAFEEFDTGIAGENPRAGMGYFEPGHYCFVAVDGRQISSRGMTLREMALLFEKLGCRCAYNLDGGHSAVMVYDGKIYSSPSKPGGREISDVVYLYSSDYAAREKEQK